MKKKRTKRTDMDHVAKKIKKLPINVLFVEDEATMRKSISEIMMRRVEKVYLADNGETGLALYKQHRPHLVLTDIRMPVMNGLEMLEIIKNEDDKVKTIVISAHSDVEYFQQAISLGVDGFILKPINVRKVIRQIMKVTDQLLSERKAKEYAEKLNLLNEMIFQNKIRAALMQASTAPSWLISGKKLLFSSNYIVDEKTPSGDFFNIIPISETNYISYIGHLPFHDIRGTLFTLTLKMTLDTIIKNELTNSSPSLILDRLVRILDKQSFGEDFEILICLIDSDFGFVRFSKLGAMEIMKYNRNSKEFYDLKELPDVDHEDESEKYNNSYPEKEFKFTDEDLMFMFSRNLQDYHQEGNKLGLQGIENLIKENVTENQFLIPYSFRSELINKGYGFETTDYSFILFKSNELIRERENRYLVNIKSVLTNTAHIRHDCEKFVLDRLHDDELSFKIELVIAEMLTNVIVHGLNSKPDTMVVLSLEIQDELVISIWDKGIKWELPDIDKENAFSLVENDATSGRGIPIIFTLSDKIERNRIDSINQTKIYFKIEPVKENLC